MPEENEFNTLGRSSPDPRMVAFKPAGERGPTVYRDMGGIAAGHIAKISRSIDERPALRNPNVESETTQGSDYSSRNPVQTDNRTWVAIPLHGVVAALRAVADALDQSLERIGEPSGFSSASVQLGKSAAHLLCPRMDIDWSEFDDPLKRKFPPSRDIFPVEPNKDRSGGKSTGGQPDLFPPPDLSEPPSAPVETPFAEALREEREREEAWRMGLHGGGGFGTPQYKPPAIGLGKPWLPPPDPGIGVDDFGRFIFPLPDYRPGTGVLGPWRIPGLDIPIGLWGGAALEAQKSSDRRGVAGGLVFPGPFGGKIFIGGMVGVHHDNPVFGGEAGVSLPWWK